jgi:hypothetical protein
MSGFILVLEFADVSAGSVKVGVATWGKHAADPMYVATSMFISVSFLNMYTAAVVDDIMTHAHDTLVTHVYS